MKIADGEVSLHVRLNYLTVDNDASLNRGAASALTNSMNLSILSFAVLTDLKVFELQVRDDLVILGQ